MAIANHDTWCIDGDGFGVQLVIVWDGDIPDAQAQVQTLPKTPVKKIKVSVTPSKEEDELEIATVEEAAELELRH